MNPQFRHGRYSRALPQALLETYEAAQADPELVEQRAELALLTARLSQLLQGAGDDAEAWEEIRAVIQEKNKVSAREVRRLASLKAYVPADQFMTVLGQIALGVREGLAKHVTNTAEQKAVIQHVGSILQRFTD